ncbi:MAG TPA: cation:proton antiporter [Mycobacterium sp.]
MLLSLIAVSGVVAGWALLAHRLEGWRITAPFFLVLAGVAASFTIERGLAEALDGHVAEHVAEVILAVLLFIDATDVRGGLFGKEPRSAVRMLFIALPLSLAIAALLGLWLLPNLDWAMLVVIACVVMPIDFAPAASILRDERIPERVRNLLNVEGGYNDGIVSPLFIFALVLAGDTSHAVTPWDALSSAVPQAIKGIAVGACVGASLAVAANNAGRREFMTGQSRRLILVAAPLLSFGLSVGVGGNGFVSAFVCGIAIKYLWRTPDIEDDLELVDDVGFLLTAAMWFVIGAVAVLALSSVPWPVLVFCLLALTVVRMVPVVVALLGSTFSWHDRLLVGWLGPRGTTSIVFGLLAFNALPNDEQFDSLTMVVVVVLGSVVLHGVGAPAAARAYARLHPG